MPRRLLNSGLGPHRPRTFQRNTEGHRPAPAPSPQGDPDPQGDPNPQPPATETQEETQQTAAAPAAEPVQVPEDITKVADLEKWVGDDPTRAQAVIDRENAGSYQRKTLLASMADIVVQHG